MPRRGTIRLTVPRRGSPSPRFVTTRIKTAPMVSGRVRLPPPFFEYARYVPHLSGTFPVEDAKPKVHTPNALEERPHGCRWDAPQVSAFPVCTADITLVTLFGLFAELVCDDLVGMCVLRVDEPLVLGVLRAHKATSICLCAGATVALGAPHVN